MQGRVANTPTLNHVPGLSFTAPIFSRYNQDKLLYVTGLAIYHDAPNTNTGHATSISRVHGQII
jgi:hypothetical protein